MSLTEHQRSALDRYAELQVSAPQLFRPRHMRPIITDRARLDAYAAEHDVVLGVAAETLYFLFVVDLVQPMNGPVPYVYSRLIHVGQLHGGTNIAVLATIANPALGRLNDVILVEQERHATGRMEKAIPRGFGEPEQDGPSMALRELVEETGYSGASADFMGESTIDSGAGDARVSFYRIHVASQTKAAPESGEALKKVHLVPLEDLLAAVRSGHQQDSFTLQALAFAGLVPSPDSQP